MTAREVLDGIKASGHARGCTRHSDCQLVTTARLITALEAALTVTDELARESDGQGLDLLNDEDFDRGWHGARRSSAAYVREAIEDALTAEPE